MTDIQPFPKARILIIDDSDADVELFRIAFSKAGFDVEIDSAANGELALDYLHRKPPYESKSLPDLIILDLNMPMISGQEVLKIIRLDPSAADIPIIVSSVSTNPVDIDECFDLSANAYVSKSFSFDELVEMVQRLQACWLQQGDDWQFRNLQSLQGDPTEQSGPPLH